MLFVNRIYSLLENDHGPQIVLERFDTPDEFGYRTTQSSYTNLAPHITTNQTIELPADIKSFRLFCMHLGRSDNGPDNDVNNVKNYHKYHWSSSTEKVLVLPIIFNA